MSTVASMGRLAMKKRGIQIKFRPSWMVYRVAPCLVRTSCSAVANGERPVLYARSGGIISVVLLE